jgi:hypothetical protein
MTFTPGFSKFVLTSHITFSVGWLGAVAVFLTLAITGMTSQDNQLARSAYLAMELSGWYVIVPFCFASFGTGLLQSIGTKWGLFRYYWITVKLFLTIGASVLLLLHMQPISYMAGVAKKTALLDSQEIGLRMQLIAEAGAAIFALLIITTISAYKPWGKIQFKQKSNNEYIDAKQQKINKMKSLRFCVLIVLIVLFIIVIFKHLFSSGTHGH